MHRRSTFNILKKYSNNFKYDYKKYASILSRDFSVSIYTATSNTTRGASDIQDEVGVGSEDVDDLGDSERPFKNYSNQHLYLLSKTHKILEVAEERLIREIMKKDQCTQDKALEVIKDITVETQKHIKFTLIPYRFSLLLVGTFGIAAVPLVFSRRTALWFNEKYVTMDIPPAGELETWLEVGNWTWNWMEPWTGTFSFCILSAQFSKSIIKRLGYKPYFQYMEARRIRQIVNRHPQYNASVLAKFVDILDDDKQ